ncbi:MAG: PEGA domain-containing protein [Myxococcales bacterium]|nr:PEGA domain-containing protein [Myxococcales bacterium]
MKRAALLLLMATGADAQPGKEEAVARFERAVKLFEAGDYLASLAEFEATHRTVGHYSVLFNIAVVHKKLFHYGEALDTFRRYLEEGGEQVPAERRLAVEREVAEIRSVVAEVWVRVEGAPSEVEVDGRRAGTSPLAAPLLLRSGSYRIRASRAGEEAAQKEVKVESGNRYTVDLAPRPLPSRTAELELSARPEAALLSVDGREVGRGPWRGELPPGGHRVGAHLDLFAPSESEVLLAPGQKRSVLLEMVRLPEAEPPPPLHRRWYTWAGAGAAVAGGLALGIYLATPRVDVRLDM